jgi:hypothetical protein
VNGFRYNARVLAEHLAQRFAGWERPRETVDDIVPFLLHELSSAPDLWVQKGYLCRAVSRSDGVWRDDGVMPLAHYLDAVEDDGAAASVEVDEKGTILPTLYLRDRGEIREHQLDPHPLHEYEGEPYRRHVAAIVG